MSYSLVPFQVQFASDACILGLMLEAASDSEKGYQEFSKNGKVYRATDYDPKRKQRVPVPIRPKIATEGQFVHRENVKMGGISVGELAQDAGGEIISIQGPTIGEQIANLVDQGKESVKGFLNAAFGADSQVLRDAFAKEWDGLGKEIQEAIRQNPFPELSRQAGELVVALAKTPGNIIEGVQKNKVILAIASMVNEARIGYTSMLDKLNNLEGQPQAIQIMGKVIAAAIPVALCVTAGLMAETVVAMAASGFIYGLVETNVLATVAMDNIVKSMLIANVATIFRTGSAVASVFDSLTDVVRKLKKGEKVNIPEWIGLWLGATCLALFSLSKIDRALGGVNFRHTTGVVGTNAIAKTQQGALTPVKEASQKAGNFISQEIVQPFHKNISSKLDRLGMEIDKPRLRATVERKQKEVVERIAAFKKAYPPVVPSGVAAHIAQKNKAIKQHILDLHPEHQEYLELLMKRADQNLVKVFHDANIHMRMPTSSTKGFLRSGMKNSFTFDRELGKAEGFFANKRRMVENIHFGINPAATGEARPVYGYFAKPENIGQKEGFWVQWYGDTVIKAKPHVRSQSTILMDDSFPQALASSSEKTKESLQVIDKIEAQIEEGKLKIFSGQAKRILFKKKLTDSEVEFLKKEGKGVVSAINPSFTGFFDQSRKPDLQDTVKRLKAIAGAKDLGDLMKVDNARYFEANIFKGFTKDDVEEIIFAPNTFRQVSMFANGVTRTKYIGAIADMRKQAEVFFKNPPEIPVSILGDDIASMESAAQDWLFAKFKEKLAIDPGLLRVMQEEVEGTFFATYHKIPVRGQL